MIATSGNLGVFALGELSVLRLSQYLLVSLQAPTFVLDASTADCLLEMRTTIENIFVRAAEQSCSAHQEEGSLARDQQQEEREKSSSAIYPSPPTSSGSPRSRNAADRKASTTSIEQRLELLPQLKDHQQGSQLPEVKASTQDSSSNRLFVMAYNNRISNAITPENTDSLWKKSQRQFLSSVPSTSLGVKRGKSVRPSRMKKRRLVAVTPYTELTEVESNLTVMCKVFGERFTRWWFRRKVLVTFMTWVWTVWAVALLIIYFYFQQFWLNHSALFAVFNVTAFGTHAMQYLGFVNAHLIAKCLRTYDAVLLLTEAFFFSSSLWALTCFTSSTWTMSVWMCFVATPYVLYDSFPINVRRKAKYFFTAGTIMHISCLVLLYLSAVARTAGGDDSGPYAVCLYRFHITKGFILDNKNCAGGQPSSKLMSFSVFDFCFNRGVNILILMLKILLSSWRRSDDCVIIRSKLRLVEIPMVPRQAQSSLLLLDNKTKDPEIKAAGARLETDKSGIDFKPAKG